MRTQAKARMGGVLAALTLVLTVVIALGIGYEQVERQRERERLPQVGRSVDIGGRTLNIYCSGEGSPAVILESNALTPGYSWVFIQREIAKVTLACWYDRAGYGWSEPAPPTPYQHGQRHGSAQTAAGRRAPASVPPGWRRLRELERPGV